MLEVISSFGSAFIISETAARDTESASVTATPLLLKLSYPACAVQGPMERERVELTMASNLDIDSANEARSFFRTARRLSTSACMRNSVGREH